MNQSDIYCDLKSADSCETFINNDKSDIFIQIKDAICKIISDEQFLDYTVEEKRLPTSGGSYLGDLYEVCVLGKSQTGFKEIYLFVKNIIAHAEGITTTSVKDLYKNEIFMYTELSSLFDELQSKYNVPLKERFKMVKFYNTNNTGTLVMENMTKKGFHILDRFNDTPVNYAEAAVETLAKFHSFSMVIKKYRPDIYMNSIRNKKCNLIFNDDLKNFVKHTFDTSLQVIRSKDNKVKIQTYAETAFEKIIDLFNNKTSENCVLCHGDYRINNILMKINEGDLEYELIPIDYQLIYYGNPVQDFLYFMFCSTDQKFREKYFEHLKNVYFRKLKEFLQHFEIASEEFYTKGQFEKDLKVNMDYGLISAILYLPFILAPTDDFPDLSKENLSSFEITVNELYIERINEVVEDFTRWGYL